MTVRPPTEPAGVVGPARPTGPVGSVGPARRALLTGLAGVAPLVLAGCTIGRPPRPAATEEPGDPGREAFVMVIRHGEKPDAGHPGRDEAGKPDGKSLTKRGWARAEALPSLFTPPAPGLRAPVRILAAADQGPSAGAHRMRQTVTPLAGRLGLAVNTAYAESQESALARSVLSGPGPVLICWEHSRIPRIVEALGAADCGVPHVWPDRFDPVWVLSRPAGGAWTFHEVRQHLLDGDD
ncbi:hypothetical protein [Kitasatospora sp. NPDC086791]|uniref:hypothetical protein n=1 Tax=Kitasatospora sp. NPDC086791 TaxID=3155178 RepID=UPI003443C72B